MNVDQGFGGMPLLGEDNGELARTQGRPNHCVYQERGQRGVKVAALLVLAGVNATRVMSADPLSPAMPAQQAVVIGRLGWGVGGAYEEKVCFVTALGQCIGEMSDPHTQATGSCVRVGTFKRYNAKAQWRMHQREPVGEKTREPRCSRTARQQSGLTIPNRAVTP